jgi:hypothetical protein
LRRWRVHRPASPTGLLFPTRTDLPVSSATLRVMVKRRERKAGLAHKDVHSPILQYTCATELYRQTKDIRLLQKALGYTDLSTMMIDTPIVDDSLETVESREEGEGKFRPLYSSPYVALVCSTQQAVAGTPLVSRIPSIPSSFGTYTNTPYGCTYHAQTVKIDLQYTVS